MLHREQLIIDRANAGKNGEAAQDQQNQTILSHEQPHGFRGELRDRAEPVLLPLKHEELH